jgi:ferredoxin-type protein NapG
MHAFLIPIVNPDYCTGCGACEQACPTEITSIRILSLFLSEKNIGTHYIVGWEKKDEKRLKNVSTDVTMNKTRRNEKSAIENVNDVDGILKGLYNE